MHNDHTNEKFMYRGKEYGIGTLYTADGGKTYYEFVGLSIKGNYSFVCTTPYVGTVNIHPSYIDSYELTIIEPDENYKPLRRGRSYNDTTIGWMWYIIIMFGMLLFKDFVFGWIIATTIFRCWIKNK